MVSFDELKIGDSAEIIGYHANNAQVSKLQAMGLVPGTTLTVIRSAPLGDPIQVSVRGFDLGISKRTAELLMLTSL